MAKLSASNKGFEYNKGFGCVAPGVDTATGFGNSVVGNVVPSLVFGEFVWVGISL